MPLPGDLEVHLVNTIDEAMAMKRWLGERRELNVIGLDTETSGIDPYAPGAKLRLVQIGDENSGWAVPWEQWGGAVMECLDAWDGPIALHNSSFDARWLAIHAGWDVPWHRLHDTMLMAQIDRPGKRAGLKPLSQELIDPRATVGDVMLKEAMAKEGWGWENIPVDYQAYWAYGALDPVLTVHLYKHFRTDLKYPRVYDLEMATRRVMSKMEDNGSRVDLRYCEVQLQRLTDYVDQSKKWAMDNWGVSITSPMQLVKFFESIGVEITQFTAGGAPSMNKEQLKLFANGDHKLASEAAKFITKVRKADKLAGTYFTNFLSKHDDGVLHPSINTLGARTGRMSIKDPALQTLPKGEALVRDAFIPRSDNEVIISSDYSQIEMRLMAHFSRDENLCAAFREADSTGGDFFVNLGRDIYNEPGFTKEDKRRGLVKNTLYGAAYGAGVQKMADSAGVTFDQMKSVSDAVFSTYPGIKRFMKDVENEGVQRERNEGEGYIITPYGRRLPCDKGRVYSLTNYSLQGHAAELLKDAVVKLDAAGYGDYMMLPIHDEVVFSVPKEEAQDAMREIGGIMSFNEGYAVPLTAEPEGPLERWGEKYRKEVFDRSYESDTMS